MTTSPVLTITNELLDDLQQKAKAADSHGSHIYTHWRDSNNWQANEAWATAANPATILALVEHIRSLTEWQNRTREYLLHVKKCLRDNGEYAPLSHQELEELLGIGPYAIAREGQSHE